MTTYSMRSRDCAAVETFARAQQHCGMPLQALSLHPHWPANGHKHVDVQFESAQPLDELLAQLAKLPTANAMFDTLRGQPVADNPMTPVVRTARHLITRKGLEQLAVAAAEFAGKPGLRPTLEERTVINLARMAQAAAAQGAAEDDLSREELERFERTAIDSEDTPGWGYFIAPADMLRLTRMALRLHAPAE